MEMILARSSGTHEVVGGSGKGHTVPSIPGVRANPASTTDRTGSRYSPSDGFIDDGGGVAAAVETAADGSSGSSAGEEWGGDRMVSTGRRGPGSQVRPPRPGGPSRDWSTDSWCVSRYAQSAIVGLPPRPFKFLR